LAPVGPDKKSFGSFHGIPHKARGKFYDLKGSFATPLAMLIKGFAEKRKLAYDDG